MQKAIKWLDSKKVGFHFHDYKVSGIDKATLEVWLQHFPIDKLINTKGTTYRALGDVAAQALTSRPKAIKLMMEHTSIIKRPVWDLGNGSFFLGWDEQAISKLL